jgi:hypothetical protein
MSLDYYVYAYLRTNGTPYYVGKGIGNRAWKRNRHFPPPKDRTQIVICETGLSEIGALAIERRLIRWYGRKDNHTGVLRNLTDGGDGSSGFHHSEDAKRKMSVAKKGKPSNRKGAIHSEDSIKKMRASKQGNKHCVGRKLPKLTCPQCNRTMDSANFRKYGHGIKCQRIP